MARHNELAEWKQRLSIAHRRFKTVEPKIKRSWKYYRGDQWGGSDGFNITGYKDKTVDNVIYSNIRAIVPRLNFKNPKIFVRPEKKPFRIKSGDVFDTIAGSAFFEIILNYYYKILEIKREARKCLYDALLSPWGIMELGYTVKTEKIQDGELLEVNELIKEDSPFCLRRNPVGFRSDPEGIEPSLIDARWIALQWIKPLEDIKKDPRLSNTSRLKSNFRVKTDFTSASKALSPEEIEEEPSLWGRVEGWTIWDRKERRIMDIVEDHDKFLRNDDEWPLDLDGFPVETLYFNESNEDPYPIPDVWLCLDMQDELNRIGSLQLDHIRRISQRRYVTREGAFQEEEERKLTHGGDGTAAKTSMDPPTAIMPLTDATISQDIYMVRNGVKQMIRQMMGVSDAEALQATKFDQATEPALIEQASMSIRGDQQQIFENFIVRVIRKLGKIIQQTQDPIDIPLSFEQMNDPDLKEFVENKLVKIVGPDGAIALQPWLEMSKDDIRGDYLFDIEIGSTMPVNEQMIRQDAINLYKLLAENPFIKAREGTKEVLTAFGKQDPEKYLKTEEQVSQGQQAARQAAIQGELALDTPKRQADVQKTAMKTASAEKIAKMKALSSHAEKEIDYEVSDNQNRAKLLSDALKARSSQKGSQR